MYIIKQISEIIDTIAPVWHYLHTQPKLEFYGSIFISCYVYNALHYMQYNTHHMGVHYWQGNADLEHLRPGPLTPVLHAFVPLWYEQSLRWLPHGSRPP